MILVVLLSPNEKDLKIIKITTFEEPFCLHPKLNLCPSHIPSQRNP